MKIIREFQGEYRFLSNFYEYPFNWYLDQCVSVEHGYQAFKSTDRKEIVRILNAKTPGEAKKLGRQTTLRPDWNNVKRKIMFDLVYEKFSQSPLLKTQLLATGNAELQEGNTWHDLYWGVDLKTGYGQNWLGKILMMVRELLKD